MESTPLIRLLTGVALSVLAGVGSAQAGSFYLQEQSITGMGSAFAGQNATGFDASTVYTNPAGMTNLDRSQVAAGANLILFNQKLRDTGTVPATGTSDGGNPYDPAVLPNLYGVWAPTPELRLGMGVSAPFGLSGEYEEGWFGRYDSVKSHLQTINLGLSAAYKINNQWSLGAGIDVQRAEAELTNAVPGAAVPTPATDLLGRVKGDDWSVGFNAGLTFKPVETVTMGLTYRSAVSHKLEGTARVRTAGGVTVLEDDATAKLKTPDIVGLGLAWDVTPEAKLLAQVNWFNWSNFKTLRVVSPTGALNTTSTENYHDSYSVALGGEYKLNPAWTLRAGVQYDTSPTNDNHRSTRVPDGDRINLGLGASWGITDNWALDAAYLLVLVKESDLSRTQAFGGTTNARSKDPMIHVLGLQARYKF
ncbi:OmpP1/FadL family transporter [Lacibacterium aquatile]|uniref:OmpP1/FadL family transporter n=1 Tax=Lacibacterium aquatile TaxID=1168082 RepID=A0ABW5DMH6_9PROT